MRTYGFNQNGLRSALLFTCAAAAIGATPALAQDEQGGVETVVVTGSMLSRSNVETPSPVTILTSQTIQASGLTSTADVIRSLTADNSGSIPEAFGAGFAAGSSGVALRGLTVNSTLVLVNGRRTVDYPLADDGIRSFVDLNTIPLDSVDRVEVLKDGASSIYGADAIAGVVNIIMKEEFQGIEGSAQYGTSQHGGGTQAILSAMIGYGDMASDHFNAYIDMEYEKDNAIMVGQRGFPYNTDDLTSIGGLDENSVSTIYGKVAPTLLSNPNDPTTGVGQLGNYQVLAGNTGSGGTCGPKATQTDHKPGPFGTDTYCEQDTELYNPDQPEEERYGVYAHFKERFSNAATAYLDATYFENKTFVPTTPANIHTPSPHNTDEIALPAYLATGARNPNDPFVQKAACPTTGTEGVSNSAACPDALVQYLFGDISRFSTFDNHVLNATVGLKGEWHGWTYDTAFVASHAWLETDFSGYLNYPTLISDVENGTYNFIDPSQNTPAVRHALGPDVLTMNTSDEDSWDMRASHDLFALPGGEAQLGLSLEARHEAQFAPNVNNGDVQSLGLAQTFGNRNIYSASAEIGMPILDTLEADVSARFDHYSDFGDTFNPKIGVKWTPIPQVALRGTYSTGFRAPSFSEDGASESQGFTNFNPCSTGTPYASFCAAHHNDTYTLQYSLAELNLANPDIKPEKSRNYTVGTILQPFTDIDLNGTVDYYNIQKTSVIAPADPAPALAAAFAHTAPPAGYTVIYDQPDPAYPGAPARPVTVGAPYINASSLKTNGFDVNIHFGTDLWDGIHWSSNFDYTQIMAYRFSPSPGTTYSYVGTQAPYVTSSGAGTPRDKASWANTFSLDPVTVTGTLYYTDGYEETGVDQDGPTAPYNAEVCALDGGLYGVSSKRFCHVNAFWDFDLNARWHVTDSVDLFGDVRNLFDTKPPLDGANYAGVNYSPTYSQDGIVGRFYSIGVSFKD